MLRVARCDYRDKTQLLLRLVSNFARKIVQFKGSNGGEAGERRSPPELPRGSSPSPRSGSPPTMAHAASTPTLATMGAAVGAGAGAGAGAGRSDLVAAAAGGVGAGAGDADNVSVATAPASLPVRSDSFPSLATWLKTPQLRGKTLPRLVVRAWVLVRVSPCICVCRHSHEACGGGHSLGTLAQQTTVQLAATCVNNQHAKVAETAVNLFDPKQHILFPILRQRPALLGPVRSFE